MTELPIRLQKGDTTPEEGVLVPLHGPGPHALVWREIAAFISPYGSPNTTAKALRAIADVAEAPRPLQSGDKIMIGDTEAVYIDQSDYPDISYVYVTYSEDDDVHRVPLSVVTRIDEEDQA